METRQNRTRPGRLPRWLRRTVFRVIVLTIILGGLSAGVVWAKNIIVSRQVQMVSAQAGSLQVPVPIQAWVANTETIVSAPLSGNLTELIPQGQRVPKGGTVAKLTSNNQSGSAWENLTSSVAGMVSYHIDGLEGLLTPANLTQWDLSKFTQLTPNAHNNSNGGPLQGGQAAFKIVDNLSPTYLLFDSPEPEASLARDDRVTLSIGAESFRGTVVKIAAAGPQAGVVVALDSFLNQSLNQRKLSLNLLKNKPATGEIIPSGALLLNQGVKGVYLVHDGVTTWQQVQVLAQDKDNSCVTGINTGDTVVTTPQLVHDGEIINGNM